MSSGQARTGGGSGGGGGGAPAEPAGAQRHPKSVDPRSQRRTGAAGLGLSSRRPGDQAPAALGTCWAARSQTMDLEGQPTCSHALLRLPKDARSSLLLPAALPSRLCPDHKCGSRAMPSPAPIALKRGCMGRPRCRSAKGAHRGACIAACFVCESLDRKCKLGVRSRASKPWLSSCSAAWEGLGRSRQGAALQRGVWSRWKPLARCHCLLHCRRPPAAAQASCLPAERPPPPCTLPAASTSEGLNERTS